MSLLVRCLTALAVLLGVVLVPVASASAAPARSFAGCPALSENRSSGPCVERLQHSLNAVNDGYRLTADGRFGASTRIAVLDFQGRNHLGADGLVGASTADELERQALAKATPPTSTPPAPAMTPFQRCQLLGRGYVSFRGNRCVLDGAVPMGLSPRECAKEEVAMKAYEEAIKGQYPTDVARQAAEDAVHRFSTVASVVSVTKCMFVTIDPVEWQAYQSVPMP